MNSKKKYVYPELNTQYISYNDVIMASFEPDFFGGYDSNRFDNELDVLGGIK